MVAKAIFASEAKRCRAVGQPLGRVAAVLLAISTDAACKTAQVREAA